MRSGATASALSAAPAWLTKTVSPYFLSSRTKFMLETLTNLKNNRIKAAPGGEAAAEATTRMKKFLSGLEKKRHSEKSASYPLSLFFHADIRSIPFQSSPMTHFASLSPT